MDVFIYETLTATGFVCVTSSKESVFTFGGELNRHVIRATETSSDNYFTIR